MDVGRGSVSCQCGRLFCVRSLRYLLDMVLLPKALHALKTLLLNRNLGVSCEHDLRLYLACIKCTQLAQVTLVQASRYFLSTTSYNWLSGRRGDARISCESILLPAEIIGGRCARRQRA